MAVVSWQATYNGVTAVWEAGDATVVSVPNYPGSSAIPAGTINSRIDYIGTNYTKTADLPNFSTYTNQIDTNTSGITDLNTDVDNLEGRVSTLETTPAPNGIASASINGSRHLIITRSDGGTVDAGEITAVDQTARDAASKVLTSRLAADATTSSTTLQTVTDLTLPVKAGKTYWFRMFGIFTAASTSTGFRVTINGPASPTNEGYSTRVSTATGSSTTTFGRTSYQQPTAATTASVAGGNECSLEGFLTPSVDGDLVIQIATNGSSSAVLKAGSSFLAIRMD